MNCFRIVNIQTCCVCILKPEVCTANIFRLGPYKKINEIMSGSAQFLRKMPIFLNKHNSTIKNFLRVFHKCLCKVYVY